MSRVATPAPISPRAISSKIQSRSPVKGSVPVPSVFSVPRTPAGARVGVDAGAESDFVAPSTPLCADGDGGGVGVLEPSDAAAAVVVVVTAAVVVVVIVVATVVVVAAVAAAVVTLCVGPGHGPGVSPSTMSRPS